MSDNLLQADVQARQTALDPSRSFIVQAPAGSGKTTVLTARLLRLLLEVDEPEEILAITFTRKAAAEMLNRVVSALRQTERPTGLHQQQTWELAQRVRERSQQRGWALEQSVGRLRVQTIDALNYWIAAQLPASAGIGGRLQVDDDVSELYQQAALRMLTQAQHDAALAPHVERLLARSDNDWGRLIASFAAMLPLRGHWLPHLQAPAEELVERVQRSLQAVAQDALHRLMNQFDAGLRELAAKLLTRAAANLEPNQGTPLDHWRAGPIALGADLAHLEHWREVALYSLVSKKDAVRRRLTATDGIAAKDAALKADAKAYLDMLASVPDLHLALRDVAELPEPVLRADDAAALQSIATLLMQATAELQLLFAEAGRVDHVYVAGAARQALLSAAQPSDLALRLGNRFRHILVDEFQDTSLRQVQTLELLTADWQPGDGRSLFLVGDPMQSIYLFRETDVGLFLQACRGWLGTVPLQALQLRRNFRSTPDLVAFANDVFGRLFPTAADPRAGAVPHLASIAGSGTVPSGEGPNVRMHCLDAALPDAEAGRVLQIIRASMQADPAASIAVLARTREHARPIAEMLLAAGITFEGVDLLALGDVSVVQDLAALTRAVRDDGDRIAWTALLRGPCCGLTLADLERLFAEAPKPGVLELCADTTRWQSLSEDGRARVGRVLGIVENCRGKSAQLPGVVALEEAWRSLGGPAACLAEAELDHARRYFDELAARVARDGWPPPHELDALLQGLYAKPAPGRVKIMTIHKAKGLEFDVVILPGLARKGRGDDAALMRWVELPRVQQDADEPITDLLLAPLTPADAESVDPLYRLISRLRQRRDAAEQLRLLYVAVTRARHQLHLVAAMPDAGRAPRSGSALARLWPAIGEQFVASRSNEPDVQHDLAAPAPVGLRRLPADWRAPSLDAPPAGEGLAVARVEAPAERPEFAWVAELGRHVGTVVHAELQRASSMPLAQFGAELADRSVSLPRLRSLLVAEGIDGAAAEQGAQRVAAALGRTLADSRGRWILGTTEHREARSEYAVSGMHEGRLTQAVIDRLLIDAQGDCWIIDYKTSAHEGADIEEFVANELRRYTPQLQRYRSLVRGLGHQNVRAALYFPLLARFAELTER